MTKAAREIAKNDKTARKKGKKTLKNDRSRAKKLHINDVDIQRSYKKRLEKSEKKFGRIKKVRTFALANEVRGTP